MRTVKKGSGEMRYGRLTQTAWQRSVRRQLHDRGKDVLFGPSPVQALQRADSQERLVERADEIFPRRLRHELDVLLSGLVRG